MPAPVAVAPAPAAPNAPTPAANIAKPAPVAGTSVAKPPEGAATAPAAAETHFEVKVNGETKKYTRAEAERLLSKAGFADATVQQAKQALKAAAELRAKQAEQDALWDDDEKLEAELKRRGKLDKLSLKRLEHKMAEADMTPEQRAIKERDDRIAELEGKTKAADEEKKQAQISERAKRIQARVSSELDTAWERAGFERGADNFAAVYDVMREWRDLGLLPKGEEFNAMHADRIIEQARDNIEGSFKRLESATLKGLKGKALVDRLGKSVVDEVLRYRVELLRGGGAKPQNQTPPPKNGEATPTYTTPQELMAKMRGVR